jgi:uncharacterized protein (TIGR03435 family)
MKLLASLAVLSVCCAAAQPQQAFEAASIKPANPAARQRRPGIEGGPGTSDPGRIRYSGITLRDLILLAYRAHPYQISASGAKGLDERTFDVEAKLPRDATQAQLRLMLQNLLAERFHLALHKEEKTIPGYRLVVAKGGPKLELSKGKPPANGDDNFDPLPPAPPNELEVHEDGYPNVPPREGSWLVALRSGYARTHQLNASMADLAGILSNQLETPVADETDLKGRYEFTLSWMTAVPATLSGDAGPDLFAALRQQLGLQLEASKAPVETLVIERFDKNPSEN